MSNKSTYWVIFELIWRDFFRFFAMKHGSRIFFEGGTTGKRLMWNKDPEHWRRWRDGCTGQPLVDANMRELAATGEAPPLGCMMFIACSHANITPC